MHYLLWVIMDKDTGLFEKKNHYSPYNIKKDKSFYFTKGLAHARILRSKKVAMRSTSLPERFLENCVCVPFVAIPYPEYVDLTEETLGLIQDES